MKVFISWSGETSKKYAEAIRNWLPGVLQFVKPFFTPDDIEKGARWSSEIAKHLEESVVGIFCLTRENTQSPWVNFEAGALSKKIEKARVCAILFGLENADLKGPLVQFQTAAFSRDEMLKVVQTVNSAASDSKLDPDVLETVFEKWWPDLESEIQRISTAAKSQPQKQLRSDREILEEVLELTRVAATKGRPSASNSRLTEEMVYFMERLDMLLDSNAPQAVLREEFKRLRAILRHGALRSATEEDISLLARRHREQLERLTTSPSERDTGGK